MRKAVLRWMHDVDVALGEKGKLATLKRNQSEIATWKKAVSANGVHAWYSGSEGSKAFKRMDSLKAQFESTHEWLKLQVERGRAALNDELDAKDMIVDVAFFVVRNHRNLTSQTLEYGSRRINDELAWFRNQKTEYQREVDRIAKLLV
ncbi:hypothetical protein CYMTET_29977 [Cymbomonas tetramitiformis]|uniref:Uncharacterized protein n=1 Tax=Cymbomonas tetramitiformis TaxID=36881 RepID=A0AAE0KUE8_9CHLO|nr:hypothetical protein CYMTET_29977 [Cymbomonas tetramitiformis]